MKDKALYEVREQLNIIIIRFLLMIIFKEFKVETVSIMCILQHNKVSNIKMALCSSNTEGMNGFSVIISISVAQGHSARKQYSKNSIPGPDSNKNSSRNNENIGTSSCMPRTIQGALLILTLNPDTIPIKQPLLLSLFHR